MFSFSELFDLGWEPNAPQWTGETVESCDSYDLAVLEFDDQGWYYDLSARTKLNEYLGLKAGSKLSIVVFIHGWRHNADRNDDNLKSFHGLLRDAAEVEVARGSGCRVLGVYLAWRGLSFRGYSALATFWTRKSAALRVAIGSVREVLARLRRYQRDQNQSRGLRDEDIEAGEGTRLVLAGHSFGGLILYSAVAEYLIESAVQPQVVRPFGDLVILINPAFEATRFQPLDTTIKAKRDYAPNQRVCFMAVTAQNDNATGIAFPFGRRANTLFEAKRAVTYNDLPPHAQQQANLRTIGHLRWLTTHKLHARRGAEDKVGPIDLDAEDRAFEAFNAEHRVGGLLSPKWRRTYASGATLEHVQGDPNNPFWVVEASPEVINGHNGIFGLVFLGFLRQLCDDRVRRKLTAP